MATAVQTANGHKWHDRYPELGTEPLPIEPYISRTYFEKERERIFRKVWLNVGRVEQIPQPGAYFVKDLAVCNTSILVVRGKDGAIRAFHNMCSHRGNQLVWNTKGMCQMFTCKFHGWTYALDGALRHITDEQNFFGLKKEELGMTPVAVDTWEGFIFINVDPEPKETLHEYLGEIGTGIKGYPFDEVSAICFSWETELKANWKIVKDSFQEAYHVSTLHRRTIGSIFGGKSNVYAHAIDFTLFPRHGRVSLFGDTDWQPTVVESLAQRFGSSLIKHDFSPENLPQGVNPTRDPNWSIDGNILFPNCLIWVSEGTYLQHTLWPLAEDRTLWEIRVYYPKANTLAQRFSREYAKVIFRDLLMEDGSTMERTQSMLASGAKKEIHVQDEELLIRQHHKVMETYLNV
jgi:phenylpropionate dioxygenase-like ring-hydroxylating dioxygenase large terminal subunit